MIKFIGNYPAEILALDPDMIQENHKADDVLSSIKALHVRGQYISAHHHNVIPSLEYVTIDNHFQGICRTRLDHYFILSGGSKNSSVAQLFIIRIDSTKSHRNHALGSNILQNNRIDDHDELKDILTLHKGPMWHAGGISMCGDILLVPMEGEMIIGGQKQTHSRITFYDLSDVNDIKIVAYGIDRVKQKAGAVSMLRYDDGRFLLIVWTDSDDDTNRFDLYESKTKKLTEGFDLIDSIAIDSVKGRTGRRPSFQSIDLLLQKDGRIFITGYCNTKKTAPTIDGTNKLYAYELKNNDHDKKPTRSLYQVLVKDFSKGKHQYNMSAATGLKVTKQGRLILYSAHHWKTGKMINLAEFDEVLNSDVRKITAHGSGIIELYEHKHFKGRVLKLYGHHHAEIPSYRKLKVQGSSFNDKLSSVRYQLAEGESYVLYEHENFKGKKRILRGNGKTLSLADLGKFNDRCSSSKFELS